MDSRTKRVYQNPLDELMRQALHRNVPGRSANPQARRRLLERAAVHSLSYWLMQWRLPGETFTSDHSVWIGLSWREMAYAQAMRPMGLFGSMISQLR